MLKTIEGVYRDGKIELAENPTDVDNVRVLVVFTGEPARLEVGADGVLVDPTTGASHGLPPGSARDRAIQELMQMMQRGADLGGGPFKRDELYDEIFAERERRRTG